MTLTFLDRHVKESAGSHWEKLAPVAGDLMENGVELDSDLGVATFWNLLKIEDEEFVPRIDPSKTSPRAVLIEQKFCRVISAHLWTALKRLNDPGVRAIQVGADLVKSFKCGKLGGTDEGFLRNAEGHWYFDFPGSVLCYTGRKGTYIARALFFSRSEDAVYCVLVLEVNKKTNKYTWVLREGLPQISGDDDEDPDFRKMVVEDVIQVVELAWLYARQREDEAPLPMLPRLGPLRKERSGKQRKRQQAMLKKGSMFSVHRLDARPRDRFPTGRAGTGFRLDDCIRVAGHWRWQAHGPKWSKRRLIFIEPHLRGEEFAKNPKPKLDRVG